MTYLQNAWYVAGWDRDFPPGQIVARSIIDRPVVLYRTQAGPVAALEDRCCHRFAPLSKGRLEGDAIRCMYHGLKFAADGRCIEVPTENEVPPGLGVQVYPVVEQDQWAWVWMGDPARADHALIPRVLGHEDPRFLLATGTYEYGANYALVHDNLMDLTHLGFLHAGTFARKPGAKWGTVAPRFHRLDNGVRVERWLPGHSIAPYMRLEPGLKMDQWTAHEFLIPGLFRLTVASYPVGTAEAMPEGPGDRPPEFSSTTSHAITPVSDRRTVFYYSVGQLNARGTQDGVLAQQRLFLRAFDEDKDMLEGQQEVLDRSPGRVMMTLSFDQMIAHYRRLMRKLLEAEAA
jgi:vanillate O-demethylase monooxygenase subunit